MGRDLMLLEGGQKLSNPPAFYVRQGHHKICICILPYNGFTAAALAVALTVKMPPDGGTIFASVPVFI
jgi:hypothetical protein